MRRSSRIPQARNIKDLGTEDLEKLRRQKQRTDRQKSNKTKNLKAAIQRIKNGNQSLIPTQSNLLETRLQYSRDVASSNHPMLELRDSKLTNGGKGVFVTNHQNFIPEFTAIPYVGTIHSTKCTELPQSCYQVQLPGRRYLWCIYDIASSSQIPLANWVNAPLPGPVPRPDMRRLFRNAHERQDLRRANCKLVVEKDKAYLLVLENLFPGEELLVRYGRGHLI